MNDGLSVNKKMNFICPTSKHLPLPPKLQSVSPLPSFMPRTAHSLSKPMTMAKTPRFLTSASKTPKFPMFALVSGQPVDLTVPSDSFMVRIDADGFEIFVGGVFTDPVRVEDS